MVRKGAVAVSIWKRQSPSGFEYFDFSLSRAWKSKNAGKEGYSPNFFANNREDLLLVIQDALSGFSTMMQACWLATQSRCQPPASWADTDYEMSFWR